MNLSQLALLAEGAIRTTFEWRRIQSNADWLIPIFALVLILAFVRHMYRRDSVELRPWLGWLLTVLRTLTFLGLLILYLKPHWRTEEEKTTNSRVVVLVDTSMSMGLTDSDGDTSAVVSRIQQVAAALRQSDFLTRLRRTHDVLVAPFDEDLHRDRVVMLPKLAAPYNEQPINKDAKDAAASQQAGQEANFDPTTIEWERVLALSGEETRLGQSLLQLLRDESHGSLAGVILISDGGQNAGPRPETAAQLAQDLKVRIHAIGVGSDKLPPSVRIAAFSPPPRAYPKDPYFVTGVIQAWRMAGEEVTVQLLSRKEGGGAATVTERGRGELLDAQKVRLGADGEEVPIKFQIMPEELGRYTLCLKVLVPDRVRDRDQTIMEADIEIVDRKNHVLLFAGGPSHEYQFLRNLLYRDKSVTSDVLLQMGKPGISQESEKILFNFPETREEMYQYDCVVAFDPDWLALTSAQVELLESWVAEQGGGLLVVAGPIYAGNSIKSWIQDSSPAMQKIRALYPVEFERRLTAMESGGYSSDQPWPLNFTRDGWEADFLQIADSPEENRQIWESFPGVYGYFPVVGPKQGATVLARFSDPQAAKRGDQPVYMAWQFYGAGRVFYLGSGEMRRLRALDESYFERFYTKVIRFTSKGRLLRGSTRGMLLVGQERYRLGNTVTVQAYRLTNAKLEPLTTPSVNLQVIQPDQSMLNVVLRADSTRPGSYLGQFSVMQQGDYRLELPLPDGEEERLTQRIRVEVPNLERERPQRHDAVLGEIAKRSGGQYFVGLAPILASNHPLVGLLPDLTKRTWLTVTPSRDWEQRWLWWMLVLLTCVLCAEWLIRRLCKLA